MRHSKELAVIGIKTVVLIQFISIIHAYSGTAGHDQQKYFLAGKDTPLDGESSFTDSQKAATRTVLTDQNPSTTEAELTKTTRATEIDEDQYHLAGAQYSALVAATTARRLIHPRAIGDVVIATVDGVAVSWTNSYNGIEGVPKTSSDILVESCMLHVF